MTNSVFKVCPISDYNLAQLVMTIRKKINWLDPFIFKTLTKCHIPL